MNTIELSKKKYVVIEIQEYEKLQMAAALKNTPAHKLTLAQGKSYAYKLIDKWAKGK